MKLKNVPQDKISTYGGNKKLVYATNENGDYCQTTSSGWEVEGAATKQALKEFENQAQHAYKLVLLGKKSSLYYHMYNKKMDLTILSQSTGIFKWRIKRHFNPDIFKKLSKKTLSGYSDALGIKTSELINIPKDIQNEK